MQSPARPKLTIAACAAMHAVGGGLGWSLLPPLMPRIAAELHLSHAAGGVVWGAASLGIAVASPFGGAAVDRLGPRRVAGIAMLFGALACAARALAVGPVSLALVMFAFGLHIGFVAPSIPKALAGHVPAKNLGRANGTAVLAYTLGTAITMLAAPALLVPALGGWRPAMVFGGAAMATVAIVWLSTIQDRTALAPHASIGAVLRLVKHPDLRRVAFMHLLLFGGYLSLLGLLPRVLSESGLAPRKVGLAIAGWLVTAAVANFVGPWVSDRIGRRRPLILGGALLAGVALAGVAASPPASAGWGLMVAAVGGGCFAPLLFALPLELRGVGPARAGAAIGLLSLVGQLGGFVLPVLVGAVAQGAGFAAAMGLLAVVHAAIVLPALGLKEGLKEGLKDGEEARSTGLGDEAVA